MQGGKKGVSAVKTDNWLQILIVCVSGIFLIMGLKTDDPVICTTANWLLLAVIVLCIKTEDKE